jgi:hypothetical protein
VFARTLDIVARRPLKGARQALDGRPWWALALAALLPLALVAAVALARAGHVSQVMATPLRVPYLLILLVGACAAIIGPGLIAASFVRDDEIGFRLKPAIVVMVSAALGWLVFWVWFSFGSDVGVILAAALAAMVAIGLVLRPSSMLSSSIAAPLLFCVLIAALYLMISGDHGGLLDGGLAIAHRYWVSVDNVIPKIFADQLLLGRESLLTGFLEGSQSSERPPLQVGMIMPTYSLIGPELRTLAYVPIGLAANSVWIIAIWGLLRRFVPSERRIAVVILATALTGAVFVNTIYSWPKMLAAALVIVAATFLFDRSIPRWLAAVVSAVAAMLALLAHGSAAFGLVGLALPVIAGVRYWGVRGTAFGAVAAAIVYAPWLWFQRVFDPPGDRLIKWHLAGVIPVNDTPPLEQIVVSYTAAGPLGFLTNKLDNLEAFFGSPSRWSRLIATSSQPEWGDSFVGFIRQLQSSSMIPAVGVLLIGLAAILVVRSVRQQPWVKPVGSITVGTTLAFVLIEFGGEFESLAWLHHGPYSLLLLLCIAGALAITSLPSTWRWGVLGAHLVSFLVLWVITVSTQSAFEEARSQPLDRPVAVAAVIIAAGLAVAVVTISRPLRSSSGQRG